MNLTNESLLAVPIKDDEIFELLERLAATEEMFKTPVSTIRDVAELTEASPNLIARILGEMRGPGELEKLQAQIKAYETRLRAVESKVSQPQVSHYSSNVLGPQFGWQDSSRNSIIDDEFQNQIYKVGLTIGAYEKKHPLRVKVSVAIIAALIGGAILVSISTATATSDEIPAQSSVFTFVENGSKFTVYDDYSVDKEVNGQLGKPTKEEAQHARAKFRLSKSSG